MTEFTVADGSSSIINSRGAASGQPSSSRSFRYFSGCSHHISLISEDDTVNPFSNCLFVDLTKAGFNAFKDDQKIERKEVRKKIIQQSNCCLIIFSEGYASSKPRLDELVTILDLYKTCTHRLLPVFYRVDKSDIMHQLGSLKAAFSVYEKEIEDETDDEMKGKLSELVKSWRASLRHVAKLPSFNFPNVAANGNKSEEELIKNIVVEMEEIIKREVSIPRQPLLVGVEHRAKHINMWVDEH